MAVTNIHSIKTNLSGAISYIINGDKTVNGLYVSSYLCRTDSRGATEDFNTARQRGTGRTKILAYHIIQSFKPDEVTPEQALAVSEELCDRFLKGRYQYVLAVHTDHDHIHAHIIFNNTNAYNGLSFTTEENQGGRRERAWAKLRNISDEICNEQKLSVIAEPEKNTGVSHYERDMQIEGKSWKEKLRNKLAKIILKSDSFEDFLRRCDKKNIEVVYSPTHKYKLKYRLEGQQKFVRGETLGEFYTADAIAEQIKIISKAMERKTVAEPVVTPPKPPTIPSVTAPKTEPTAAPSERGGVLYNALLEAMRKKGLSPTPATVAEPTDRVEITAEEFISGASSQNEPKKMPSEKKNIEVDLWGTIRGMCGADEIIRELENSGITSFSEFSSFFYNTPHADDHTKVLSDLNDKILAIDALIGKMKHLAELSPTYKEYKSKSGWSQSRFKKKNASVIEDYEETFAYIKEHRQPFLIDGKLPSINKLTDMLNDFKIQFNELLPEHNRFIAKRNAADKYKRQVKNYLNEQHNKRESEMSRQRRLGRNKTYLE